MEMIQGMTALLERIDQHAEDLATGELAEQEVRQRKQRTTHPHRSSKRRGADEAAVPSFSSLSLPPPPSGASITHVARRADPPQTRRQHTRLRMNDGVMEEAGSSASSSSSYTSEEEEEEEEEEEHHHQHHQRVGGDSWSADALNLQVTRLTQELRFTKEKLDATQQRIATMTDEYKTSEDHVAELQHERDVATKEAAALAQRLHVMSAEHKDVVYQLGELRRLRDEAEEQLATYKRDSAAILEEMQLELHRLRGTSATDASHSNKKMNDDDGGVGVDEVAAAQVRELQRLHATNTRLTKDCDDCRREAAAARREVEHLMDQRRAWDMEREELRLTHTSATEALEGEVAAHNETRAELRQARADARRATSQHTQQQQQQQHVRGDANTSVHVHEELPMEERLALVEVQLATTVAEKDELLHAHHVSRVELSDAQRELARVEMMAAEWRSKYQQLSNQVEDDVVAHAAGMARARPTTTSDVVVGVGGGVSSIYMGGVRQLGREESASAARSSTPPPASRVRRSAISRTRAMEVIAQRGGRAGHVAVEVATMLDQCSLWLLHHVQHRALLRIVFLCYVVGLQVWAVLMYVLIFSSNHVDGGCAVMAATAMPANPNMPDVVMAE